MTERGERGEEDEVSASTSTRAGEVGRTESAYESLSCRAVAVVDRLVEAVGVRARDGEGVVERREGGVDGFGERVVGRLE